MNLRRVILGALVAAAASSAPRGPLSAQDQTKVSGPMADTTRRAFQIPPQPLPSALAQFSQQSGLQVQVDSEIPPVRSPGAVGNLTPAEALRRLTMGTGMVAKAVDGTTVAVRPAGADAFVLDPLEVVAAKPAGTVVTTATKTPTPLIDVPQSVTVISKTVMADQGMLSMADVTRYVPGITMGQGEGNRDQPTIRGNGTTAGFFVDGVRDDVQYFRDLYNVERVEALKGANALIFGRGTGGGVLNRVTKEAQWSPIRELSFEGGSYGTRRGAIDVGQGVSERVALRFNGMYENSDQFRHDVNIERYGINPAINFAAGSRTRITANFEHFSDYRTADRGVPSFQGGPADTDARTFFGDPSQSWSDAGIDVGTAVIEHDFDPAMHLRNRTVYGDYDKKYQNIFPGAVDETGALVALQAYNNRNDRNNLFNQTELTWRVATGSVGHTLLGGVEVGHQISRNFRNTGFFDDTETTIMVPLSSPTISRPVTFRQAESDANNRTEANTVGLYVQDQVTLTSYLQLIGGVRFERFDMDFFNFRNGDEIGRVDDLVSPRAGVVVKPVEMLSLYGSYSVSYLPSSGDQFASLTATSETLEPEKFKNYELGAKLEAATGLWLNAAVYRLDRTNTTAPDPVDPSRTVQTGSQRTKGFEVGATGNVTPRWQVAAAYTNQDAYITSQTRNAAAGSKVPLVPRNTVSLWNKYQLLEKWGVGAGVIYQDRMFAAIDNEVTLPSFTRFDAAVFFTLSPELRAQVNVENVFDTEYFITSHSNDNISPGSPRAVRATVTAGF